MREELNEMVKDQTEISIVWHEKFEVILSQILQLSKFLKTLIPIHFGKLQMIPHKTQPSKPGLKNSSTSKKCLKVSFSTRSSGKAEKNKAYYPFFSKIYTS